MKVIINRCYGGYGLSEAAYKRLIDLGIPVRGYVEQKRGPDGLYLPEPANDGKCIFDRELETDRKFKSLGRYWDTWTDREEGRTDPLVIQVVQELGEKANGEHAELKIIEIPDDIEWEIDEYDGIEKVIEKSRQWF